MTRLVASLRRCRATYLGSDCLHEEDEQRERHIVDGNQRILEE